MSNPKTTTPVLQWEIGTAYEFFISLYVLHLPELHGLRASYAAGIRSRIPAEERKFLEEVIPFIGFPLCWVYQLPKPKDAISVLWALRQIPPGKRLLTILCGDTWDKPEAKAIWEIYQKIAEQGKWGKKDLALLSEAMSKEAGFDEQKLIKFLDRWSKPEESGEMLLKGLQAYYQAFFEEEEKRVAPVLEAALERARQLAGRMSLPDLLTELSQGVHFDNQFEKELVLIPAYWTTPLVLLDKLDDNRCVFLFGARPATMSATPGELVPDGLLRALKALADSTRLKILYYLSREELTPSELSRRLHLRAPTVTHHLTELRLAGLVNLTVKGQEKFYSTRREALQGTFKNIEEFLDKQ